VLLKTALVAAICGSTLISLPAFGQEDSIAKADISVQASLPFVKSTNTDGAQQGASINYGIQGSYRFFFNRHSGAEVSYGYMHDTQSYSLESGSIGVKNNSDELFAAYVFRLPAKRWTPFVLAGAGALIFDPSTLAGTSTQTRLGYLYGGGADFKLKHRIFVRTEYRGVFYDSPTFSLGGLSGLDRFTHIAEPSIGFGYKF
jgi:opacity protein-like surface antigen